MSEQTDEYKQDPVQPDEQTVNPASDNVAAENGADRGDDDVNDNGDNRPATAITDTAKQVPDKDDVADSVNEERVQQSVNAGGNDNEDSISASTDTANKVLPNEDIANPDSKERVDENVNENAQDDTKEDKTRKSRKGKNKVHPSVETVSEYANQDGTSQGLSGQIPGNKTNATNSGKTETNRGKPLQSETTTGIDEDTRRVMFTCI